MLISFPFIVNLGERVLRALFNNWLQGRKEIDAKLQKEAQQNGTHRRSSVSHADKDKPSSSETPEENGKESGSRRRPSVSHNTDKDKEKSSDAGT